MLRIDGMMLLRLVLLGQLDSTSFARGCFYSSVSKNHIPCSDCLLCILNFLGFDHKFPPVLCLACLGSVSQSGVLVDLKGFIDLMPLT